MCLLIIYYFINLKQFFTDSSIGLGNSLYLLTISQIQSLVEIVLVQDDFHKI